MRFHRPRVRVRGNRGLFYAACCLIVVFFGIYVYAMYTWQPVLAVGSGLAFLKFVFIGRATGFGSD